MAGGQALRRLRKPLLAFLMGGMLFTAGTAPAEAGVFDRVKGWFELPGEIDRMRDTYNEVQQQVQQSVQDLENAKRSAEQLAASQKQLLEENERLQAQNAELAGMVNELRHSEEVRRQKAATIRNIILTVAALAAGYFLFGRIVRVALRSRH